SLWLNSYSYVFFFQAEDGIRDLIVTGVQTCALPICLVLTSPRRDAQEGREVAREVRTRPITKDRRDRACPDAGAAWAGRAADSRSEERRVGKECRSRRGPYRG